MSEMPKTFHVKVTQEHIDSGVPASQNSCPIALSLVLDPAFPDVTLNVGSKHVIGPDFVYILPPEAKIFIEYFDVREDNSDFACSYITPFEFDMELEIPPEDQQFCNDPMHDTPCPLPCAGCEEDCVPVPCENCGIIHEGDCPDQGARPKLDHRGDEIIIDEPYTGV